MRANEFITERKKKRKSKKSMGGYFFPGYAYYGLGGSDSSGDGGGESMYEDAVMELAKELPSLAKHDYNTIDKLMRKVAKKNHITDKALHDLFTKKYKKTPDSWIKDVKEEGADGSELDIKAEVEKFAEWAMRRVHLEKPIKIDLSYDTEEAQDNHHTGRHTVGDPTIWVYAANRNLVDILRTVFHEIVHCRQGELGMIQPGDSYPGSPIEAMADMLAGKYMKIYGEKNHHIYQ
jgi:hypothetical protein